MKEHLARNKKRKRKPKIRPRARSLMLLLCQLAVCPALLSTLLKTRKPNVKRLKKQPKAPKKALTKKSLTKMSMLSSRRRRLYFCCTCHRRLSLHRPLEMVIMRRSPKSTQLSSDMRTFWKIRKVQTTTLNVVHRQ